MQWNQVSDTVKPIAVDTGNSKATPLKLPSLSTTIGLHVIQDTQDITRHTQKRVALDLNPHVGSMCGWLTLPIRLSCLLHCLV